MRAEANKVFQMVGAAHTILSNASSRAKLDLDLLPPQPPPAPPPRAAYDAFAFRSDPFQAHHHALLHPIIINFLAPSSEDDTENAMCCRRAPQRPAAYGYSYGGNGSNYNSRGSGETHSDFYSAFSHAYSRR